MSVTYKCIRYTTTAADGLNGISYQDTRRKVGI